MQPFCFIWPHSTGRLPSQGRWPKQRLCLPAIRKRKTVCKHSCLKRNVHIAGKECWVISLTSSLSVRMMNTTSKREMGGRIGFRSLKGTRSLSYKAEVPDLGDWMIEVILGGTNSVNWNWPPMTVLIIVSIIVRVWAFVAGMLVVKSIIIVKPLYMTNCVIWLIIKKVGMQSVNNVTFQENYVIAFKGLLLPLKEKQ